MKHLWSSCVRIGLILTLIAGTVLATRAAPLSEIVTYQGRLDQTGSPIDGACNFQFSLWDAEGSGSPPSGGTQVGPTLPTTEIVSGGLFTVELNFAGAFGSEERWLQIAVRCPAGSGTYTTLSPRQRLASAPTALHAVSAGKAKMADDVTCSGCVDSIDMELGAITNAQIAAGTIQANRLAFTPGTVTEVTAGDGLTGGTITGSGVIAVNFGTAAGTVAAGEHDHGDAYWRTTGNSGTTPATNFLGTVDDQGLELRVNNARALWLEPGVSPNIIGGWSGNSITDGVVGAAIGGGGAPDDGWGTPLPNFVSDDYGTVGGGAGNVAGPPVGVMSDSPYATVGGGIGNSAGGDHTTVAGGSGNSASVYGAAVGGGTANRALQEHATVAGGAANEVTGLRATVAGGYSNEASGDEAAIGGGDSNRAAAACATIAGGCLTDVNDSNTRNRVTDKYGTIGGGGNNQAGNGGGPTTDAVYATVAGGAGNAASAFAATVGGGFENQATASHAAVGGGTGNLATANNAAVGGGVRNRAEAEDAAVAGGFENQALGARATVGGGFRNLATANAATAPGGANNVASGSYSFAAGAGAQATHPGSFVWTSAVPTASWGDNTFTARAPGGFRFYFDAIGNHCDLTSTSGWVCPMVSDVNTKTDTAPVDGVEVLDRLAALPVQTWSYKAEDGSIRHMGPMAQDFHAAFRLGANDREINTVDATGVALAAIQGLNERLRERDAQIAALETRLAVLEAARPQEVTHAREP